MKMRHIKLVLMTCRCASQPVPFDVLCRIESLGEIVDLMQTAEKHICMIRRTEGQLF